VRAAGFDAHLVWLGDGPLRVRLEALRDRAGLGATVHLLGFRDDARSLMAQCTIAALASETEGIATTLIEAQAAGLPVVATAVGGVPEVVHDGRTGLLVAPRDPRALADAIVELLGNPTRRSEMAAAARSAALEFHIDRTVERTMDAYLSVWAEASTTA
jgi:glycosyltransferase involved in cell wall biosynthesis